MAEHTPDDPSDYNPPPDDNTEAAALDAGDQFSRPSEIDPMYDSGIIQEEVFAFDSYTEFGVARFAELDMPIDTGEAVIQAYDTAWQSADAIAAVHHDNPAHYWRKNRGYTSAITSVELHNSTPFGTARVVRDESGLSIDYYDNGGGVQCNRYTVDRTTGAVYKDTTDRTELLKNIPPVGAVPRDSRMRMIADTERGYREFAQVMGFGEIPVGQGELEHILIDIAEGRPPQVTFNDLRRVMLRRRDSHEPVTDEASHRAIAPLRAIVSRWSAMQQHRHPDGDPSESDMASASDETPGTLSISASYVPMGQSQRESATIRAVVKAPLEPGEVAAYIKSVNGLVSVDPEEAGWMESTVSLTEIDGKVYGQYEEKVFSSTLTPLYGEMCLYNADEDDVYYARNLLFDPSFYKLEISDE